MKLLILSLLTASAIYANDEIVMTRDMSQPQTMIEYRFFKCGYKSASGLTISIITESGCPFSIYYNPLTQSWRR